MIQYQSMEPRASSACWSAPASGGNDMSSYSMAVCWLGIGHNNRRSIFDQ